jgi:hypothetical protein
MKQFKGMKNFEQLKNDAIEQGWEFDQEAFDKGSDFICLRDMDNRVTQIMVNTFNGHFAVYKPFKEDPVATHLSEELDKEDWYNEILDLLYEPLGVKEQA